MKATFKELKETNLPLFLISDNQEWEAMDNDFNDNDILDYEVSTDLDFNEYILITGVANNGIMASNKNTKIQC